jgi:hypothetical protein
VENLTYPAVEAHDNTFGDSNQYSCTDCHDSAGPSDGHVTGVKQSPADTNGQVDQHQHCCQHDGQHLYGELSRGQQQLAAPVEQGSLQQRVDSR